MSYILDALKKSEAERSRGVVPTLLTPPQTQFRSGVVGWILVAVLIVNAGLLAWWLYWPTTDVSARTPQAAAPTVAPTSARTHNETTIPAAAPPPLESSAPPDTAPPPLESPVRVPAPIPTPTIASEPSAAESDAGTADVSFSTHVYATDPSMRAVTMNGKRFVEGDTIRPGVRIREITETGVVLDVNGRPIPVDVLQDWR